MSTHTTPRVDRDTTAVSAQVLVRSASGARVRGDVPITSGNIAEYTPSTSDTEAVRHAFHAAGFIVGPLVGISCSITAPVARFESFFAVTLRVRADGAVQVSRGDGNAAGAEASAKGDEGDDAFTLPLSALPADLADRIVAVTFTPPADLHGPKASAMF
jgi:hypothetical protein